MRNLRQGSQFQRFVKVLIDVFEHLVHAPRVFSAAISRRHEVLNAEPASRHGAQRMGTEQTARVGSLS